MAIAYYSRTLPFPVEVVWETIADFHGLAEWIERIVEVEPEGGDGPGVVGSVRRITLTDGRVVGERLVAYDPQRRAYSYEFASEHPFPVRRYRATVRLCPIIEDDTTFMEWFGEYDCDADDEQPCREQFLDRYRAFCADLAGYLGSG